MKILLTGGAGYVGTRLAHRLLDDPSVEELRVYDNLSAGTVGLFLGGPKLDSRMRFVCGDILDSVGLGKAMEGVDAVIHLAAKTPVAFAEQAVHVYDQINHWGTAEVCYAVERSSVRKLLFTSSSAVYGTTHSPAPEVDEPSPGSVYGISKLRGEKHVRRMMNVLDRTYILRVANVYGFSRSMRFDGVINRFMFDANFTGRLTVHGDGSQRRSFVQVDRLCNVLQAVAAENTLDSGTYNVADLDCSLSEVIGEVVGLYPALEMLFTDQDVHRTDNVMRVNPAIEERFGQPRDSLASELARFRDRLTF